MKEEVIFESARALEDWLTRETARGATVVRRFKSKGDFCAELLWPPEQMRTSRVRAADVEAFSRKPNRATEPDEYKECLLLAGRWIDPPGAPITAFAKAVRSLLIEDQKLSTADALSIATVRKPDLFASSLRVFDALAHKVKADQVECLAVDRAALKSARGW